ncbi:MAG: hypothetical protein ACR2KJ_17675 [Jatrophihabitans sp.]
MLYDLPFVDGAAPPPPVVAAEVDPLLPPAAAEVDGLPPPDDEHAARASIAAVTPVVAAIVERFIPAPLPKVIVDNVVRALEKKWQRNSPINAVIAKQTKGLCGRR